MKHRIILLAIAALAAFEAAAARPRLVVNIVVGSMRAEDLGRYADNYGEGGLRRLLDGGTVFADSRYDYQQTTTPVSLATLTTGAMPSTHGVIGARWRDYVENDAVELIAGRKGPGPYNLIAPTLAEALLQHEPGAKAVSVATEAMSAVIMAGHGGEAFWLDSARCGWETSPYYAPEVPEWVARSNRERYNLSYIAPEWRTLYEKGRYLNTRNWDIVLTGKSRKDKDEPGEGRLKLTSDYDKMLYTPAGNTAVLGFAKQAIAQFKLGDDATPDLLNICLDTPRRISEAYGPESVEVEDMYYRLDRDLADFLTFVFAQVRNGEVLVVFTSDHGEMLGSQGLLAKNVIYPESFEIPFIVSYPGHLKHRVEDLRIAPIDVMPTVLGLMGLGKEIPKTVEGVNYAPALLSGDFSNTPKPKASLFLTDRKKGIRTDRYTYQVDNQGGTLIFDNRKDPYCTNNLAPESVPAADLTELKNELGAMLKLADDPWVKKKVQPSLITY